jgi:hypothetical protein
MIQRVTIREKDGNKLMLEIKVIKSGVEMEIWGLWSVNYTVEVRDEKFRKIHMRPLGLGVGK